MNWNKELNWIELLLCHFNFDYLACCAPRATVFHSMLSSQSWSDTRVKLQYEKWPLKCHSKNIELNWIKSTWSRSCAVRGACAVAWPLGQPASPPRVLIEPDEGPLPCNGPGHSMEIGARRVKKEGGEGGEMPSRPSLAYPPPPPRSIPPNLRVVRPHERKCNLSGKWERLQLLEKAGEIAICWLIIKWERLQLLEGVGEVATSWESGRDCNLLIDN